MARGERGLLYKVILRGGPGCGPKHRLAPQDGSREPASTRLPRVPRPAQPVWGRLPTRPRPPGGRAASPGGPRCRAGAGSGLLLLRTPSDARRPSGYFSSGGAGRALGAGSGSQSRNSWSSVLTVSGHSSITMWLPSSMSFRKARSRICGGCRLRAGGGRTAARGARLPWDSPTSMHGLRCGEVSPAANPSSLHL
uniref:Uncharacterized protein n=1 Tax=Equus asinus TaxID=9793 RepID=A0A9L0J955_EQUAS